MGRMTNRKCQRTLGVSIRKSRKAYDGPGRSIAGREEHFSERWIRGVDQGWIRVDQGGSGVDHPLRSRPRERDQTAHAAERTPA